VAQVNPNNNRTTTVYDAAGQAIATIDPLLHRNTTVYDAAGRTKASINGVGDTTRYAYDIAGRQTATIDGNGKTTTNVYDNDNRQTATISPLGDRTTNVYDNDGRVVNTINEEGKVTTTVYDKVSRTLSVTNPLAQTHSYEYDDAGRQVLRIDARGLRTTYVYDKVNRQTVRQYQDGTLVTQVYDAVGNRTLLHDSTGRYTVAYDSLNRPEVTTEPNGKSITIAYDKVGQRSHMDVPTAGRVTYTHDSARQLTNLQNGRSELTTLAYDAAGRRTATQLSNGSKTSLTYDAANQTTGIVNLNSSNTTLSYYNYRFDGIGDRTSLWDNGVDVSNWNYDFTGQLTNDVYRPATTALNWNGLAVEQWSLLSVSGWSALLADHVPTGGAGKMAYSPAGNRLTQADPVTGDITTFSYDNGNRLLTGVDVSGTTTYTYDLNGNQLTIAEPSGDITTNVWNGENRLVEVHHPSGDITTYAYNGDGLRVVVDDGTTETRFVYDGNNVVLELDDVGSVDADFTYVPATYAAVLSQHRDGDSSFYLFDGIHNARQLTDDAQVVTDEYSFDGWGKLTSSTGSTANSQLYKGQYLAYRLDPNAGPESQYSTHNRNYNPKSGLFTSADPAKDDLNLYRYVKNNPVNSSDPSGLQDEELDSRTQELIRQDPRVRTLLEQGADPAKIVTADRIGRITAGIGALNFGYLVDTIPFYGSTSFFDSSAESAAKRGYMVVQSGKPLPIVDRATREAKLQKDITEEFDALAAGTTAEREVLEGQDLKGRGVNIPRPGSNKLTAGSLRGQNYIIALDSVTDDDLKRMSTPQKLAVALQYAGKHDMFRGETTEAMKQLVQPVNLAILAFVTVSLLALAAVATLAAGAAGPP
jgi:RHS repeat-associated protein